MEHETKPTYDRPLPEHGFMGIPEEATRVFEGVLFDVYQWQQLQFDGSYKTFEMLRRPDTVLVIALDEDENVVVLREEQPGLPIREHRLPGGRVDQGYSSLLQAAQQELLEETGIVCAKWRHVETVQLEKKIDWCIHVFLAEDITSEGEPTPDVGGERILEIARMPYEQLRNQSSDSMRLSVFARYKTLTELKDALKNTRYML